MRHILLKLSLVSFITLLTACGGGSSKSTTVDNSTNGGNASNEPNNTPSANESTSGYTVSVTKAVHLTYPTVAFDGKGNTFMVKDDRDHVYFLEDTGILRQYSVLKQHPSEEYTKGFIDITISKKSGKFYVIGQRDGYLYEFEYSESESIRKQRVKFNSPSTDISGKAYSGFFGDATSVDSDKNGNIFLASKQHVLKISPDNKVIAYPVGKDRSNNELYIVGLAVADDGSIFFSTKAIYPSKGEGFLIKKIDPSGSISIFSGTGTKGLKDGAGDIAMFDSPKALDIQVPHKT
jgi:hypothetical protein